MAITAVDEARLPGDIWRRLLQNTTRLPRKLSTARKVYLEPHAWKSSAGQGTVSYTPLCQQFYECP